MHSFIKPPLLFLYGIFCCVDAALATDNAYELGEILVVGKSPRVVESVVTVDEISADDIGFSAAANLSEALALLPGLYIRTGGDGTPRIDIRGLRTRQVSLLMDGVPLASAIDGQFDPAAIGVANIESIKVTRGANSVLYGAGGSAGVINIITRAGENELSGKAKAEFGGNGVKQGQLSVAGGGEDWQAFASFSGYERNSFELSDDYDAVVISGSPDNTQPAGKRINSDRSDINVYGNVIWRGLARSEIGLSTTYRQGEYGKPGEVRDFSGADADPFARRPRFERVDDFESFSVNLSGSHEITNALQFRSSLYFNRLDELTNNYDDAGYNTQNLERAFSSDSEADVYGARFLLAYVSDDYGLASFAGDCRREDWTANGFEIIAVSGGGGGGGGGGATTTSTALIDISEHAAICSIGYEHELKLGEDFAVVAGLGYAWQNKRTGDDDEGESYLLGAYYDLFSNTRLHFSHAKKIRFPTLRDLFEPGRANPDLDAETSFHYEAGLEQSFEYFPAKIGISYFYIDAEDFIETDNTGLASNIEKNSFQGVEVSASVTAIENLLLRSSYTYQHSKNKSAGVSNRDLQNRPEHQYSIELNYRVPRWDFEIYASFMHIADSIELSRGNNPMSREIGDYEVLDLKLQKNLGSYYLYLRASNLLDENYAESGGFPAEGRTVMVGGGFDFGS